MMDGYSDRTMKGKRSATKIKKYMFHDQVEFLMPLYGIVESNRTRPWFEGDHRERERYSTSESYDSGAFHCSRSQAVRLFV